MVLALGHFVVPVVEDPRMELVQEYKVDYTALD